MKAPPSGVCSSAMTAVAIPFTTTMPNTSLGVVSGPYANSNPFATPSPSASLANALSPVGKLAAQRSHAMMS
ncbi:MAG: hypothetical protein V4640_15155 [Verrucomicrobiota bacterium]